MIAGSEDLLKNRSIWKPEDLRFEILAASLGSKMSLILFFLYSYISYLLWKSKLVFNNASINADAMGISNEFFDVHSHVGHTCNPKFF